jgi:hypothetical protein
LQDLVRLDVELLQFVAQRQVDAPAPGVVADVADDVGQLHGQPSLWAYCRVCDCVRPKMLEATSPTTPATRWQ